MGLIAQCVAPLAAALPLFGLFGAPEPELVYRGSLPGGEPGVQVFRDAAGLAVALAKLDPAFADAPPDVIERTVLLVTGRPRENACRESAMTEVSTRGSTATITLEESVVPEGCACPPGERPPAAWVLTVSRYVKKAVLEAKEVAIACPAPDSVAVREAVQTPVLLLESAWEEAAGSQILTDDAAYRAMMKKLNVEHRAETVDFTQFRVVVLTGRPRENGCRSTRVLESKLTTPQEAEFLLEELYPDKGQVCAQVFMKPRVFIYRVPATVEKVRVTTKEGTR
ncbi:MAG: hypothetical protein MUC67_00450 [Acidobacteria bacterium]|jgi:hypothetical protein|nr:hypothetical protein [Acidobacteriota bacterium]